MDTASFSSRNIAGIPFWVAASSVGVCAISSSGDREERRLRALFPEVQPASTPMVEAAFEQLEGYLEGRRRDFDVPLDLRLATPFGQTVLKSLLEIPYGETTTYGRTARALGSGPRAVGGAVGRNPIPVVVPCHRVIAGDGSLGGYSGGLEMKRRLLAVEGHPELSGGWTSARLVRRAEVSV